jgi:ferredoxin-type protein NapF
MDNSKIQSRKEFFSDTFSFLRKGVGNHLERKVLKNMALPVRPPGAIEEVEFLSICTRCDACLHACPHHSILKKAMVGLSGGTPFIDPQKQGCHLCEDYPCIQSCEPKALVMTLVKKGRPRMGRAVINTDHCLTWQNTVCTACYDACPFPETAITIGKDRHPQVLSGCVGCGLCTKPCPSRPHKAIEAKSHAWLRRDELEDFIF